MYCTTVNVFAVGADENTLSDIHNAFSDMFGPLVECYDDNVNLVDVPHFEDAEMCGISQKFPNVRFNLYGHGDNVDDVWEDVWLNGKHNKRYAIVPAFNEEDLEDFALEEKMGKERMSNPHILHVAPNVYVNTDDLKTAKEFIDEAGRMAYRVYEVCEEYYEKYAHPLYWYAPADWGEKGGLIVLTKEGFLFLPFLGENMDGEMLIDIEKASFITDKEKTYAMRHIEDMTSLMNAVDAFNMTHRHGTV